MYHLDFQNILIAGPIDFNNLISLCTTKCTNKITSCILEEFKETIKRLEQENYNLEQYNNIYKPLLQKNDTLIKLSY